MTTDPRILNMVANTQNDNRNVSQTFCSSEYLKIKNKQKKSNLFSFFMEKKMKKCKL